MFDPTGRELLGFEVLMSARPQDSRRTGNHIAMKLGDRGGIHFRGYTGPGCLAPRPVSPISLAHGAAPSRGGHAACKPLPPRGGDGVHSRVLNAESLPDATVNPLPAAPHEPVPIQRRYARALQCGDAT